MDCALASLMLHRTPPSCPTDDPRARLLAIFLADLTSCDHAENGRYYLSELWGDGRREPPNPHILFDVFVELFTVQAPKKRRHEDYGMNEQVFTPLDDAIRYVIAEGIRCWMGDGDGFKITTTKPPGWLKARSEPLLRAVLTWRDPPIAPKSIEAIIQRAV